MIEVNESAGQVTFLVRVQPRASRSELAGEWQGALRIRLEEPPLGGRANDGLRRFLATYLNVPLAAIRIARGEHNRTKRVEITGATAKQIYVMAATSSERSGKDKGKGSKARENHAAD